MERMPLIVCGLYRSGTNFAQQLIRRNLNIKYPDTLPNAIWAPYKHTQCREDGLFANDTKVVLTFKDPYAWTDSICRKSIDLIEVYSINLKENETPIEILYENDSVVFKIKKKVTVGLEQLCAHYNRWMQYWRDVHQEWDLMAAFYNDWVFDNPGFIDKVQNRFQLDRASLQLDVPRFVIHSDNFTPADLFSRYHDPGYEFITEEHQKVIKENINWENYEWLMQLSKIN